MKSPKREECIIPSQLNRESHHSCVKMEIKIREYSFYWLLSEDGGQHMQYVLQCRHILTRIAIFIYSATVRGAQR